MKLNKEQLKRIIKEELAYSLGEAYGDGPQMTDAERDANHGDPNPYGSEPEGGNLKNELDGLYQELIIKIDEWGTKNADMLRSTSNPEMLSTLQLISTSLVKEIAKTRGEQS